MSKHPLATAISLLFASLCTSAAADTTFGGIIFTDSYYVAKNAANNSSGIAGGTVPKAYELNASRIDVPNISRLRMNWTNEDSLGMYIELGLGGGSGATGVGVRHAYGTYQITTQWQVLVGHSSSPLSPLFPSQLIGNSAAGSAVAPAAFGSIGSGDRIGGSHNVGKGYGDLDSGRSPQVRFTYALPNQHGAIAIAVLDANQGTALSGRIEPATGTPAARGGKLPRIDIGAAYNLYGIRIFPGISFQQQSYSGVRADSDRKVRSSAASLGVQTGTGAFEFSAEINAGRNWRNAAYSIGSSAAALGSGASSAVTPGMAGSRVTDTDSVSYWADLGWRLSTVNTKSVLHLVVGEMKSEADGAAPGLNFKHKSSMVGLSWPIDLPEKARGLTIRPEVFMYKEGRSVQGASVVDYGKELVAGVQLQYTF